MKIALKIILLWPLFLVAEEGGHDYTEELTNRFNEASQIVKKVAGPSCTFFDSLKNDPRISPGISHAKDLIEIEKTIIALKAKNPKVPNYWAKEFKDAKLFSELTSRFEKNFKEILIQKSYLTYKLEDLLVFKELLLTKAEIESRENFNKNIAKPIQNYSEAVTRIALHSERQLLCPKINDPKAPENKKLSEMMNLNFWYAQNFKPGTVLPIEIRTKLIHLPDDAREKLVQILAKGHAQNPFEAKQFLSLLLNPTKSLIEEAARIQPNKTFVHPLFLKEIAKKTQNQNPPYKIEEYNDLDLPKELVLRQWALKQISSPGSDKSAYLNLLAILDKTDPSRIEKNLASLTQNANVPLSELNVRNFIENKTEAIPEKTLEYILHELPLPQQAALLEEKYEQFKDKNPKYKKVKDELLVRNEFFKNEWEATKLKGESEKNSLIRLFEQNLKHLEAQKNHTPQKGQPAMPFQAGNSKESTGLQLATQFLAEKVYAHKSEMGFNIENFGNAIVRDPNFVPKPIKSAPSMSSSQSRSGQTTSDKRLTPEQLIKTEETLNERIITFQKASEKLNAALTKIQKDLQNGKALETLKYVEGLSKTDPKLYKELLTTTHYFPNRNMAKELITFAKVPPQIRQYMEAQRNSQLYQNAAKNEVSDVMKNYPKVPANNDNGIYNHFSVYETVKNMRPEDIAQYWHDWQTALENKEGHQIDPKTAISLNANAQTLHILLNKSLNDNANKNIPNSHPTNAIKLSLPSGVYQPFEYCTQNTVKPFVDLIWKDTFTPIQTAQSETVAKLVLDHAPLSFEKFEEKFGYSSVLETQIKKEQEKANLLMTIRDSYIAELAFPEFSEFQKQNSKELSALAKENIVKIILSIDGHLLKHYGDKIQNDKLGIKSSEDFKTKIQEEADALSQILKKNYQGAQNLRSTKETISDMYLSGKDGLKTKLCRSRDYGPYGIPTWDNSVSSYFGLESYELMARGSKFFSDDLYYYGIPSPSKIAIHNLPKHLRDVLDVAAKFGLERAKEKNRTNSDAPLLNSIHNTILNPTPENILKMVRENPALQAAINQHLFSKDQTSNGSPKGIITNRFQQLEGMTRFRKLTPSEEKEKWALYKLMEDYEQKKPINTDLLTTVLKSSYSKEEIEKLSQANNQDMEKLGSHAQNESRNFIAFMSVALTKKTIPDGQESKFKPHELHPDFLIYQEQRLQKLLDLKSPEEKHYIEEISKYSYGADAEAKAKLYALPKNTLEQLYKLAYAHNENFNELLQDPTPQNIDAFYSAHTMLKESEKAGSVAVVQWRQENDIRDAILEDLAKNKKLSAKAKIYISELADQRLQRELSPEKIAKICEDKNCTTLAEMKKIGEEESKKLHDKIKLEIEADLRHTVALRQLEAYRNDFYNRNKGDKNVDEKFRQVMQDTLNKMVETSDVQIKSNLEDYREKYETTDPNKPKDSKLFELIKNLYELYPLEFKHEYEKATQQEPIQNVAFDALKQGHVSQNPIANIVETVKRNIQKNPEDSFEISEKAWIYERYCSIPKNEVNLFQDPTYESKRLEIKNQEREFFEKLHHLTKKVKDLFAEKVFIEARLRRYQLLATTSEFQDEMAKKSSADRANFNKRLKELPTLVSNKTTDYELAVLAYRKFIEETSKKAAELQDSMQKLNSETAEKIQYSGNIPNFSDIPIPDVLQLQKTISNNNQNLCSETNDKKHKQAIEKLSEGKPNFTDKAQSNLEKYFQLRAMSEEIASKLYADPNWKEHTSVQYWIKQATSGMYGVKISALKAAQILSEEINKQKQKEAKAAPFIASLTGCKLYDEKTKQITIDNFNGGCNPEQLKQTLNNLQKIKPELFQTQDMSALKFSDQIPAGNYLLELIKDKWAADGKPKAFAFGKAAITFTNSDPKNPQFAFSNLEDEQKKYDELVSEALTILKSKYPKALASVKGEYNRAMYDPMLWYHIYTKDSENNADNKLLATDARLREITKILGTDAGTLPLKPVWSKNGETKSGEEWQAHIANQFNNQMRIDIQDTHNLVQEAILHSGVGLGVDLASLMFTGGSTSAIVKWGSLKELFTAAGAKTFLYSLPGKTLATPGKVVNFFNPNTEALKHLMHNPNIYKQLLGQSLHGLRMSEALSLGGYTWREGTEAFKHWMVGVEPDHTRSFSVTDHYHEHFKSSLLFALSPFSTAAFGKILPQAFSPAVGGFTTNMAINSLDLASGKVGLADTAIHSAQTAVYFLGMDQKAAAFLPSTLIKIKGAPFATSFAANSGLSSIGTWVEWSREYNRVNELHKKLLASGKAPEDEEKYKKILDDLNKPGALREKQMEAFVQGIFSHSIFAGMAEAHAKPRRQAMNLARLGEAKGGVVFNSKKPVEIISALGNPKTGQQLKERGLQTVQFLTGEEILNLQNKAEKGSQEAAFILNQWLPEAVQMTPEKISSILKANPSLAKKQLHQIRPKLQEAAFKQLQGEIQSNIETKKSAELNKNVAEAIPLIAGYAQSGTVKDVFDTISPRQLRLLDPQVQNEYLTYLANFYKIKNDEGQFNKYVASRKYTNQKNWIDVVKEYRSKLKI